MDDMNDDLVAFGDATEMRIGTEQVSRKAPPRFVLIKFGKNHYSIDGQEGDFELNPDDAKAIVDEFNKRSKDLVVDYDHATIKKDVASKGDAPAAGWVRKLYVGKDGIEADDTKWTDKAKGYLENGEYRYFSPVMHFKKKTKRPFAVQSIALTNHPAIHGASALVAANDLNRKLDNNNQNSMMEAVMDKADKRKELEGFANEVMASLKDLQIALTDTLGQLGKMADGDAEIKAFNDFKNNLLGLADTTTTELADDTMAGFDNWLADKLAGLDPKTDHEQIFKYECAKGALREYRGSEPTKTADEGGGVAGPSGAVIIMPDTTSKITSLGLSDLSEPDKFVSELKAMSDMCLSAVGFLKTQKAESFDDIGKKIVMLENKVAQKEIETKETLALNDATMVVTKAMNDGKIAESNRDWAIDYAKRDVKGFTDFVNSIPNRLRPPTNKLPLTDTSSLAKPIQTGDPKKMVFSKEQLRVAKAFDNDPMDVYGAFDDMADVQVAGDDIPFGKKSKELDTAKRRGSLPMTQAESVTMERPGSGKGSFTGGARGMR